LRIPRSRSLASRANPQPNTARWRHAGGAGFAVLVPERPAMARQAEDTRDQRGCDEADYAMRARLPRGDIAALTYLREQSFVRQDAVVILGHSAGWLGCARARRG